MNIATILQLITAAAPVISSIILMIKNADGSTSVIVTLNAADAQLSQNQQQIQQWFKDHGLTPPPASTVMPTPGTPAA